MDSIHSPVLARAVTGRASLGRRGAAGEGGGIEVGVRGGVLVVVAAEAGRGGRTLRREVVARGVDRGDARLQRRDVRGRVHVTLGAVARVAGEADLVEVERRAAEAVDGEVLRQIVTGVNAVDQALEGHRLRLSGVGRTARAVVLDGVVADHA